MLEEFGEQIEIIPQTVEAVHTHTHTEYSAYKWRLLRETKRDTRRKC